MAPTRRRRSPVEIEEILAAYHHGGVTQRELAERHGVCVGTLQNWLRRSSASPDAGKAAWVELIPEATKPGGAYRIEFPGGPTLVLGPGWRAADVRELIQVLATR
jgi:transcriptional regulator with XRE-family HTH domain